MRPPGSRRRLPIGFGPPLRGVFASALVPGCTAPRLSETGSGSYSSPSSALSQVLTDLV